MMNLDSIPQEVLKDFQKRTVVSVQNLRWANRGHTLLTSEVLFKELEALGPVPFTTMDGADTEHGRLVWEESLAGTYGAISDYVPPTVEETRANLSALSPRQIRLALNSIQITESAVETALAGNPDGLVEWRWATRYDRNHPLVVALAAQFNLPAAQIDTLWQWAMDL